jgi:hypothetical protein
MIISPAMQNHNPFSKVRLSMHATIHAGMLSSAVNRLLPCRPYSSCAKACVPDDCNGNACLCPSQDECVNGRVWRGYPARMVGRSLGMPHEQSSAPWVSSMNGQARLEYVAQTVGRTLGILRERSGARWMSCSNGQAHLEYPARKFKLSSVVSRTSRRIAGKQTIRSTSASKRGQVRGIVNHALRGITASASALC